MTRVKEKIERDKGQGKDREGQEPRVGWRGTRTNGRVERDKNQGKGVE